MRTMPLTILGATTAFDHAMLCLFISHTIHVTITIKSGSIKAVIYGNEIRADLVDIHFILDGFNKFLT